MGKDFNVDSSPENDERLSRINAAGIINVTLENLWRECYSTISKGDLVSWNRKLDSIWVLLGGDVKEGSKEEEGYNKIEEQLFKTGGLNHKKVGWKKNNQDESRTIALQYLLLRKKSLFLRRLQNKQGKGTAYETEEDGWD